MDNKKMLKRILLLTTCMFCLSLYGQNIQKHYVFKAQEKGSLYHLLPVTLFEDDDKQELSYDLTYTSWSDTIVMNFTYVKQTPLPADSVLFVAGSARVAAKVERLYVEPTSKKWVHRYTFSDKKGHFTGIYKTEALPELTLYSKGKKYIYYAKKGSWRKYMPIGSKLFEMIYLQK